jgi:hypothetical protein
VNLLALQGACFIATLLLAWRTGRVTCTSADTSASR